MRALIRSGRPAQPRIDVHVAEVADGVSLISEVGTVRITTSHPAKCNFSNSMDYAAWYLLPVAMRLNRELHIHGRGSATTVANFRRMSQVWQSWLPGHFFETQVTFASEGLPRQSDHGVESSLLYFSGGLDAAYCALMRQKNGKTQHLLTVHGMDYNITDERRFEALKEKTRGFATEFSDVRIVVRSDVYSLYDKLGVNLEGHHLAHIFSLAGAGFFHANSYRNLVLAADEPIDGQFMVFPWGSNSATNQFFDNGQTKIVTESEGVRRAEKLRVTLSSQQATGSLSFCWNRTIQPANCGRCEKCIRTKMLSLADSGMVPRIFLDMRIPDNWANSFNYRTRPGYYILQEILSVAKDANNVHLLPRFDEIQSKIYDYYSRRRLVQAWTVRFLYRTGVRDFVKNARNFISDRI